MHRLDDIIPMAEIVPNSPPVEGAIVIIDYPKVRHYAYVEQVLLDDWVYISECNLPVLYGKVRCGTRIISPDYERLVGFFDPNLR